MAAVSTNTWTGYQALSECWIDEASRGGFRYNDGARAGTSFDMYGNDDAVIFDSPVIPTPDIDLHVHWNTSFDTIASKDFGTGAEFMRISGNVTGDGFPAAEAFVYDGFGNGVMLGASPVDGARNPKLDCFLITTRICLTSMCASS